MISNQTLQQKRTRNRHRGALNFEKFAAEGNRFIHCVAEELGVDRNRAARITKAVLHAVRDRLPPDDSIQFAQGLPMALKAVYLEQYDISDTPVILRRLDDFLGFIRYKAGATADMDFPTVDSLEDALIGIFNVLEDYMETGQLEHIKHVIGGEVQEFLS